MTTVALALAARWPAPARPVVVECDPSGGSLLGRFRLVPSPGLVSLTAAARRTTTPDLLWSHVQHLPGGLPTVVAPPGADYTRAALHTLLDSRRGAVSVLRAAASPPDRVVIADCGRFDHASPALSIARDADRVLLLVRPQTEDLMSLATGLEKVDLWAMRPGLLLVGPGYSAAEVTRGLGIPVMATIPLDQRGARAFGGGGLGPRRGPTRSALGRVTHRLARSLTAHSQSAAPPLVPARETSVPVMGFDTRWRAAVDLEDRP
ncbi:chromosome partitioning protein [Actinophytocola sediminis]